MNLLDKAAARFAKQALDAPSIGTGGSLKTKTPSITPPGPATGNALSNGGSAALTRFTQNRSAPLAATQHTAAPQQSAAGAQMTNTMRNQFSVDPSSYMQMANRSGPVGGLLGAGSLFNADGMKAVFGRGQAPEQAGAAGATPGAEPTMLGTVGNIGREMARGTGQFFTAGQAINAAGAAVRAIPGGAGALQTTARVAGKIPGVTRLGGLAGKTLGVGSRASGAVSGALNVGWAPIAALTDLASGDTEAAGKRFYDSDYNRLLADSSKSYASRTWEAMAPEHFYKNVGQTAGGLTDGHTYSGLMTQIGLNGDGQTKPMDAAGYQQIASQAAASNDAAVQKLVAEGKATLDATGRPQPSPQWRQEYLRITPDADENTIQTAFMRGAMNIRDTMDYETGRDLSPEEMWQQYQAHQTKIRNQAAGVPG